MNVHAGLDSHCMLRNQNLVWKYYGRDSKMIRGVYDRWRQGSPFHFHRQRMHGHDWIAAVDGGQRRM